jgi:hypothetical protein
MQSFSNLAFCIVAGHSAYPSVDPRIPIIKAFHYVFSRIRKKTDTPLFLGAENISSSLIDKFIKKYEFIVPFLLHGDPRALYSGKLNPPYAIYSPITNIIPDDEAIKLLTGYLLRRKAIQRELAAKGCFPTIRPAKWEEISPIVQRILKTNFQKYVLTSQNYKSRIQTFYRNGVQLIVANPIIPGRYFDLIRGFKINLIQNPYQDK